MGIWSSRPWSPYFYERTRIVILCKLIESTNSPSFRVRHYTYARVYVKLGGRERESSISVVAASSTMEYTGREEQYRRLRVKFSAAYTRQCIIMDANLLTTLDGSHGY